MKFFCGAVASVASLFAPVEGLVICAVVFVAIDFVMGVAASRHRARKQGLTWRFSSRRAWDTVLKAVFTMAGIALAWLLDSVVLTFVDLHLANLFTGFVCGVEFWSYLENAADLSGHPLFLAIRKMLKKRVDNNLGI